MRAIEIGTLTYGSMRSILDNKLDRQAPTQAERQHRSGAPPQHPRSPLLPLTRQGEWTLLTHPMLDQLHQLGLSGMAQAFAELEASGEGATLTHADSRWPAGRS